MVRWEASHQRSLYSLNFWFPEGAHIFSHSPLYPEPKACRRYSVGIEEMFQAAFWALLKVLEILAGLINEKRKKPQYDWEEPVKKDLGVSKYQSFVKQPLC